MEVITLRAGESVTLRDDIRITVTDVDSASKRARLGVEVPVEVAVLRGELLARYSPAVAPSRSFAVASPDPSAEALSTSLSTSPATEEVSTAPPERD